jgi:hypothetical protein
LHHQKQDTKNGPRRQRAGKPLPSTHSAHRDGSCPHEMPRYPAVLNGIHPIRAETGLAGWGGRIRTSAFRIRSAGVGHRLRLSLAMRCGTTTFNRDAHVRLLPSRAESLGEFRFGDAEVRILPPQPASPSLTRTKADRARNAATWRHFAHKGWSPCAETGERSGISAHCLRGRHFGVSFFGAPHCSNF